VRGCGAEFRDLGDLIERMDLNGTCRFLAFAGSRRHFWVFVGSSTRV
jgi:hypothetical protein